MKKFLLSFAIFFSLTFFAISLSHLHSVRITEGGEKYWAKSGESFTGVTTEIYSNTRYTNRVIMVDTLQREVEFSTNNMGIKIGDTLQIVSNRGLQGLFIFPSAENVKIKK